jgi:hypothetical protein
VTARRIALMATSWARVPQRAQRHDRSALEKAVGLRIWFQVAKIELELWSFFMGISKEEGSTRVTPIHIHINSADVPRRDSFCLPPGSSIAFGLQAFVVGNEPVLMVPDEHELQGQIYGVGEPLPSQL